MDPQTKKYLKARGQQVLDLRQQWLSKKSARHALARIESFSRKTDPQILRRADEYAAGVLGSKDHAHWLYVYGALAGTFKEGWIPKSYYELTVVPRLKATHGKLSLLNTLNSVVFSDPLFPEAAKLVNGSFFTQDHRFLPDAEAQDRIFANTDKVVFKADGHGQGVGVHVLERDDFNLTEVKAQGNGIFQEFIDQHDLLARFMPASVATIRVTTVMNQTGVCSVRGAYLRLGRTGHKHVSSADQVRVPVNIDTGALGPQGYLPSWQTVDRHPDTGVEFNGFQIPEFSTCLSTAKRLHEKFPFVCCIGWDLAVDKNNDVKVMEWNGNWNDIKFSEATQGPCFVGLGWEDLWRQE